MGLFLTWFRAKPHRATLTNILMLTLLLEMVGSAELFQLIGSIALVIAGASFLGRAMGETLRLRGRACLSRLAILWLPGLAALVLAAGTLALLGINPVGSLFYNLSVALFGAELASLVLSGPPLGDPADDSADLLDLSGSGKLSPCSGFSPNKGIVFGDRRQFYSRNDE